MPSPSQPSNGNPPVGTLPPGGLPPVAPPTAGFLVRLFLVPATIVAVGVGAAYLFSLTFGWLLGSPSTPEQFLAKFDDANPEVRWRAAADLSQRLLRDDNFASDADFALELVKRLQEARANSAAAELELSKRFPPMTPEQLDKLDDAAWLKREKELERENKKLDNDRNYIKFLTACLGNFMVPVGVPVLSDMALQEKDVEHGQLTTQRVNAVWSLAVLGDNTKRFDKLKSERQTAILDKLEEAMADKHRGPAATAARDFLLKRQNGVADAMGVDAVLETCAKADDPFLRELTAFALNFWFGNDAANKRMEQTLDLLSRDSGEGALTVEQRRKLAERSKLTEIPIKTIVYTQPPELNVKLNATIALARRGSDFVSTGRLAEMLDQDKLRKQFLDEDVTTENPKPDEAAVVQTVVNTLKAIGDLHKQRPEKITAAIRAAVDKLKSNSNSAVKKEAEQTALAIGSGQS
jgi:hypothetical protein